MSDTLQMPQNVTNLLSNNMANIFPVFYTFKPEKKRLTLVSDREVNEGDYFTIPLGGGNGRWLIRIAGIKERRLARGRYTAPINQETGEPEEDWKHPEFFDCFIDTQQTQ